MIKEKYLKQIKEKINKTVDSKNWQVFIFGSGLTQNHFGDIDLGFLGSIDNQDLSHLKQEFEESALPYEIDLVNFNRVSNKFKNNVMENKIIWIKR